MKKLAMLLTLGVLALSANEDFSKKGFLATKWCIENNYFKDCRLESYFCKDGGCFKSWDVGDKVKEELVLYVHDEGKIYNVKLTDSIPRYELDHGALNANEVIFEGRYDSSTNTIYAKDFKAPPPPKKSFFKGCL